MIHEAILEFGDNLMRSSYDGGDFQITLPNLCYIMLLVELVKENIIHVSPLEEKVRIPLPIFVIPFGWQEQPAPDFAHSRDIEVPRATCVEIKIPTVPGYCTVKPEKPLI